MNRVALSSLSLQASLSLALVLLGAACAPVEGPAAKGDVEDVVADVDDAVADGDMGFDSARRPTRMGEALANRGTYFGRFASSSQYLAWTFTAREGEHLDLIAQGAGEDDRMDTVLVIYRATEEGRPTGMHIAFNDDDGPELSSRVQIDAPADGTFVAVVRRYDLGTSGEIGFAFRSTPAGFACGAPTFTACGRGHFCNTERGVAHELGGLTGECQPVPEFCPTNISRVCGVDGVTYDNACLAHLHYQSVAHRGSCDPGV